LSPAPRVAALMMRISKSIVDLSFVSIDEG
jgi:hypothetical protein